MNEKKIPLWLAILTNVNIVIGSAFFVGAPKVAAAAGYIAPLAWGLIGLLLAPLVIALVDLSGRFPAAGGLYVYAQKTLGRFFGFISGWGYFVGTSIGNGVVLHEFTTGIHQLGLLPHLGLGAHRHLLTYDFVFLALAIAGCLKGIEVLKKAQIAITTFTIIPIVLTLVLFPFIGTASNVIALAPQNSWLVTVAPLILFAYVGIEACCALGHSICDGKKNTGKATYLSFLLIMATYGITQYGLMSILGARAASAQPFAQIVGCITSNVLALNLGTLLINVSILISFLGGFYGMLYSNNWNLYAMAQDGCLPGNKDYFIKQNKHGMPYRSVYFQAVCIGLFLFLTGNEDALMNMSDLGVFCAYGTSTIAYCFYAAQTKNLFKWIVGLLATLFSTFLIVLGIKHLILDGLINAIPFVGILGLGITGYLIAQSNRSAQDLTQ